MLKQIPTLDSFSWQPPIISILNTPPVEPSKGDRYIVGEGTGDWSGQDNNIAWYDTAWNFTLATDGMTVFDMSANSYLTFDITSDSWVNNSDLYLKLDQTIPQTFTAGDVSGTGLLNVTLGVLGLDTKTYIEAGDIDWATNVPLNETDPVFSASDVAGVTTADITNWDTAYGWGDHAGLYDLLGTASGLMSTHESTYDHTLIATALQAETDPVFTQWLSDTPPLYAETDPVFSAWLIATPPLYSETDPLSLHLDQTTPQTFTAGDVSGSGLLKVTAGELGLDTNTYLTDLTGALLLDQTTPQTVSNGLPTFSSGVISPYVYGSNTSGGDILLSSTSDATKGAFNIQVRDGDSVLGSELITNGTFTGSATGWTLGTGWAYDTNNVTHTPGTASALEPSTPVSLENGKAYYFTIVVSGMTAGTVSIRRGTTDIKDFTSNGDYSIVRTMATTANFNIYASADFDGTIDSVSIKEVTSSPSFSAYTTSPDSNGSIDFRISDTNLSIGTNAGRYIYGSYNTNLGFYSGYSLDGSSNTNLGRLSGYGLDGSYNTNLGFYSGYSLDGSYNTNLGFYSGYSLDGSSNTNLGRYSGYNLVGSYNTNLGRYSGAYLSGFYNTNIGNYSGYGLSGDSNVFIGYNARFLTSIAVNNKLFIDVEQTDTPLIYGEFDNGLIRINGDLEVTDDLSVTDRVLVGTDASLTDFSSAQLVSSNYDTGFTFSSPTGVVGEGGRVGVYGVGTARGASAGWGVIGRAKTENSANTGNSYGVYAVAEDTHEGGSNQGLVARASGGATNYAIFADGSDYSFYGDEGKIYNEDQLLIGATASLTDFANTKGIISLSNTGKSNADRNALVLETTVTGSTSANGIYVAVGVEKSTDTGVARAGQFLSNSTHNGNNYAIYADANNGVSNFSFYGIHGQFYNAEGIRTQISNANVSNPPTDAQLDSAFGDPTTKGSGWIGVLDDAGAGNNVYFVYTTGNAGEWFWVQGTKAT